MKNYFLLILIGFSSLAFSQGQFGFSAGLTFPNYKTNDLLIDSYSWNRYLAINSVSYLSKNSDLIIEAGYEVGEINVIGFRDYNKNIIPTNNIEIKTTKTFIHAIYNKYLITPEASTFHASVQGGFGTSVTSNWEFNDERIVVDELSFTPYFIIGVSAGTEQLRFGLRYQKSINNQLRNLYYEENIPSLNNTYKRRQYNGNLGQISISLTYYLEPFYF